VPWYDRAPRAPCAATACLSQRCRGIRRPVTKVQRVKVGNPTPPPTGAEGRGDAARRPGPVVPGCPHGRAALSRACEETSEGEAACLGLRDRMSSTFVVCVPSLAHAGGAGLWKPRPEKGGRRARMRSQELPTGGSAGGTSGASCFASTQPRRPSHRSTSSQVPRRSRTSTRIPARS